MQTIFFYKNNSLIGFFYKKSTQLVKDYLNIEVDKQLKQLDFCFRSEPTEYSKSLHEYSCYDLDKKCFTQLYKTSSFEDITGYFYNCYI